MKYKRIYRTPWRNEKVFKNEYTILIEATIGGNKNFCFVGDIILILSITKQRIM